MSVRFGLPLVLLAGALPWNLVAIEVGAGLGAAVALAAVWKRPRILREALSPVAMPLSLWLLAIVLSLLAAPLPFDFGEASTFWPALALPVGAIVLRGLGATGRKGRKWMAVALGVYLLSGGSAATYAVAQHFTGVDLFRAAGLVLPAPHGSGYRAVANFNRHTTLAFALCYLVPFAAVGFARFKRIAWRLLSAVVLLVALGALAWTYVRMAWLGLAGAAFLLAFLLPEKKRRKRVLALASVSAVLLGAFLLAAPSTRGKLADSVDLDANWGRLFMWNRTLEMIREHPVTGVGYGNYQRSAAPYYDRADPSYAIRCHAHNLPLHMWAETGPAGPLGFAWLWLALLLDVRRRRDPWSLAAAVGCLATLLGSFAQDTIFDGVVAFHLWLFGSFLAGNSDD